MKLLPMMDFTGEFPSILPLATLLFPPDLSASPSLPAFTPLSPPLTLFSSPSLLPHFIPSPPSSLHFETLHSHLRSELPCHIFSPAALYPARRERPPFNNLLVSLPSYCPNTFHLFFPTGENAHAIAFLSLTSRSDLFQLILDDNGGNTGDVFKQTEGLKQPSNRISSLSVLPCSTRPKGESGERVFEGFLMATTLYTLNWFRVETGPVELGGCEEKKQRPFLVPLANYGFQNPVVHACFSQHFKDESAVLLQNGDLYLFDLCTKKSGRYKVMLKDRHDSGSFISCEYGAQPWTIIVACTNTIFEVDVRYQGEGQTRVLFRVKELGCYDVNRLRKKEENFLVFCKSSYSNYHFSVLTKSRLMLLDVRRPLHPVLTWDHGLHNPNYVGMLKLEELKPSYSHEAVSGGSAYSILAGSLSSGEFKLFHYGSIHNQEPSSDSSLFAWGVPSGIFLSGDCSGTSKELMAKIFSVKSTFVKDISWLKKQERIVGFFMIPSKHSSIKHDSSGFTLIRLMSFGRLEVQNYVPSDDIPDNKMCMKEETTSAACDILTVCPDYKSYEMFQCIFSW